MKQKDEYLTINGEKFLSLRQLAEREGFSIMGMKYRVRKLGIGVKPNFTNRTFVSLKDVKQAEKEGKFLKLK